ncbi:MAG: elongation factor P [Chitinivibrionales bacterium]|nr:elongation factor P [Chitinivibrionales bacterium]MBD3394728.1 elongation factor P [Chitinivibrionales bacterium]
MRQPGGIYCHGTRERKPRKEAQRMINATQIRKGMVIIHEGEPHKVMEFRFTMQGRGANSIPTKLRNILTGTQAEVRYRSDDRVEKAFIEDKDMEYLYEDSSEYWFMDQETFEQISIPRDQLEDIVGYLLPNSVVKVQLYDGKPIGVSVPPSVQLKVEDTEPAIKGATASGNVTKPATLETGLTIQVPMFVSRGDTVIVNTTTGEYQGRPGRS